MDPGMERSERARALSILDEVERELGEVDDALRRLDEGTYGLCLACGAPLRDEDLAAMPGARFCAGHEAAPGPGDDGGGDSG